MQTDCNYISYESTGHFSKIMLDYIKGDDKLNPFYKYPVSLEGAKAAIQARKQFETPRNLLVTELRKQYTGIELTQKQEQNLQLLLQDNTFTTCTAHQPNIFTGHLYFIYKILHAVKLAAYLKDEMPEYDFVPVYYMGSEDADLEELGHINLFGEKLEWETKQTGAVGRMKVDAPLIKLLDRIAGQLEVLPYGKDLILLFRNAYRIGETIQRATLQLVNGLFKDFGLLVLIPDNRELKKAFTPIIKRELAEQFSHTLIEKTSGQLGENYKVQASGRDINLFYLAADKRVRIEKSDEGFEAEEAKLSWTPDQILKEAEEHPEIFSANVILRGLFQEMILPNIAFIGGGGEIAYWLELKEVFDNCHVPFPVLVVRNSFLLLTPEQKSLAGKLGFEISDLFKTTDDLVKLVVTRHSNLQLKLDAEKEQLQAFYGHIKELADKIDSTLSEHTIALETNAAGKLSQLEKKMLRAEKRKFEAHQRQVNKLKKQLFPNGSLQERTDNFAALYAQYGREWLNAICDKSLRLEQQFAILEML